METHSRPQASSPALLRALFWEGYGLLSQVPYGTRELGTDLLGISYLHYIA